MTHVVILGAGHAGGTAAALLRQYGHQGAITLVGDEPLAPYQRPPLSKAWLKGEVDAESLALKPLAFYAEHEIDFRPSLRATRLDRAAKEVRFEDGERLGYDVLILATGARALPLPIPGADLNGVTALRTAADADRLKAALGPGRRLAVIGGGYIGLEVAASARALGAQVTVLKREPRLLARVACPSLSDFFQSYHEKHGGRFAVFHLKGDQVQAVEAVNSPPDFMVGRQLIGNRKPVDPVRLVDLALSLKEVAA